MKKVQSSETCELDAVFPFSPIKKEEPKMDAKTEKKGLVKYWIVPPLNPALMDEFERQYFQEEPKDSEGSSKTAKLFYQQRKHDLSKNYGEPPFIPERRRDERTFVHLCWIYMWCGTLFQQDKKEQLFRTNQLLQVISKLKAKSLCLPDTKIFFLIIDTCYRHGMFKMTKRVYESMRSCHILPSNAIFRCFFQHQKSEQRATRAKVDPSKQLTGQMKPKEQRVRKERSDNNEYAQNREYLLQRKEEQLLDSTSKLCRQINYSLNFRKRTFKTKEGPASVTRINCEQVRLKLEEECKICHGQLLASQLRKAIAKANQELSSVDEASGNNTDADCSQKVLQLDALTTQLFCENGKKSVKKQNDVLCTFCGEKIDPPKLVITIGKQVHRRTGQQGNSGHTEFDVLF